MLQSWLMSADTATLAQGLLGSLLQVDACSGWIVETEAYLGETDRAAHAFGGLHTKRNGALYGPAGTIYVYQMRQYCLLNLITQKKEVPQGILIRAVAPISGIDLMERRRHTTGANLTSGPGKLTSAFGITLADNWQMVNAGRIHVTLGVKTPKDIKAAPRIGVPNKGQATLAPLRFYVAGNPYVSKIKKQAVDNREEGWKP